MFQLLKKLLKVGLLTPAGLFYLAAALVGEGTNLMALLRFGAKRYDQNIALTDETETLTYADLYHQSQNLATVLHQKFQLKAGQKIAFLCRSHASLMRAIFAVARLGANVYLLNPEMSQAQFAALNARHRFDFLVYDAEVSGLIEHSAWQNKSLIAYHPTLPSVENFSKTKISFSIGLKRAFSSEIIVLTGGTTGEPKIARRKSSVSTFLNPFFELLTKLNLDQCKSVYIATPAYHGFGIAAIFIGVILGEKMFLMTRFDARKACRLIEQHKIEAITVVPLMLQRILHHNAAALASLNCIISGGAAISPVLVEETLARLGDKLFNLYGTSEAGFSVLATPADLRYAPDTIGKKIAGVRLRVLDENNQLAANGAVGKICIKSKWAVKTSAEWIETGDLGFQDDSGYLFLRGRNDEMIISGGENVYPVELENVLVKHPEISQAAAVGVPDAEFGQRLKAFVIPKTASKINETEIFAWLDKRIARFQMPVAIEMLEEFPLTSIGKVNKKVLANH